MIQMFRRFYPPPHNKPTQWLNPVHCLIYVCPVQFGAQEGNVRQTFVHFADLITLCPLWFIHPYICVACPTSWLAAVSSSSKADTLSSDTRSLSRTWKTQTQWISWTFPAATVTCFLSAHFCMCFLMDSCCSWRSWLENTPQLLYHSLRQQTDSPTAARA